MSSGLKHRGGPTQPGVKTRWPGIKCFLLWHRPVLLLADARVYTAGGAESPPHTQVVGLKTAAISDINSGDITGDNEVIFLCLKTFKKKENDAA